MGEIDLLMIAQTAPKAIHEWALLVGAVAVAIKESPRGFKTVYGVYVWLKRNVFLREEYRKIRHLHQNMPPHEEDPKP